MDAGYYLSSNAEWVYVFNQVIEVYSHYLLGWGLSNKLVAEASLQVLKEAVVEHGKPEIVKQRLG